MLIFQLSIRQKKLFPQKYKAAQPFSNSSEHQIIIALVRKTYIFKNI